MHIRDSWIILPLTINLVWLIGAIIAGTTSFPNDSVGRVLIAVFSSTAALAGIIGFIIHDIGAAKSFITMLLQTFILTSTYAIIYQHGMNIPIEQAIHFSLTTWTSRGYTVMIPQGDMLIATSLQAITGYIYLGLLISILSSAVNSSTKKDLQQ